MSIAGTTTDQSLGVFGTFLMQLLSNEELVEPTSFPELCEQRPEELTLLVSADGVDRLAQRLPAIIQATELNHKFRYERGTGLEVSCGGRLQKGGVISINITWAGGDQLLVTAQAL